MTALYIREGKSLEVVTRFCQKALWPFYNTKGLSAAFNEILLDQAIAFGLYQMRWNGFRVRTIHTVTKDAAVEFSVQNKNGPLAMRTREYMKCILIRHFSFY
jgi:hypothetical protein